MTDLSKSASPSTFCPHGVIMGGSIRCLNCRPYELVSESTRTAVGGSDKPLDSVADIVGGEESPREISTLPAKCCEGKCPGHVVESASPSEPRPEIGKPCPTCGREVMPEFGPGDYSCAVCGFGMLEPCEHWKAMLAQPKPEEPEAAEPRREAHSSRISPGAASEGESNEK